MILISAQAFPPRSGGIQTLMAGLADAASVHEDVYVYADGTPKQCSAFDSAQHYYVKRFHGLKPLRRRKKAKAIKQTVESKADTHIICDSWKSAEYLPSSLTCPITVYAHGNEFPADGSKRRRIRKALTKADRIIAVSSQTADRLKSFLPQEKPARVDILSNPVNQPIEASEQDKRWANSLWPENTTRLLCLCRLIDWKGVDRSILSLLDCHKHSKPAHLVIAGDGDDEDRLRALVEDNGLETNVTFVGRVEGGRKTALFESADIYMQPGRTEGDQCEGFGITYIEAGLHGLPSIAGQDGGAPDAVRHENTGLIVNGRDQENVSAALLRLIDEPALTSHMGKDAQYYAQDLLWDKQIIRVLYPDRVIED